MVNIAYVYTQRALLLSAVSIHTCWDLLQIGSCRLMSTNTPFFRRQILTQTWFSSHRPSYCTPGL